MTASPSVPRSRAGAWLLAVALVMVLAGGALPQQYRRTVAAGSPVTPRTSGALALSFEANAGQADKATKFLARSPAGTYSFEPNSVTLALPVAAAAASPPGAPAVMTLHFLGAAPAATPMAGAVLPGQVNYFTGRDRGKWLTGVPTYSGLTYADLYPGVSLAYEGPGRSLKGTYTVAASADPGQIRWRYDGAQGVSVDAAGNLEIRPPRPAGGAPGRSAPVLTEHAPVAWQEVDGHRRTVTVGYRVGADGSIGFTVGAHDPSRSLVIDPTLTYSTYVGASSSEGTGVAVDRSGNAYVAGDLPPADGQAQPLAYVSKLSTDGSTVLYTSYLTMGDTAIAGIAVDPQGNVYATGRTWSPNFPIVNTFTPCGGTSDPLGGSAFLIELVGSGQNIAYSACLGVGGSRGTSVAFTPLNPNGGALFAAFDVYVTGATRNLTTTTGAFQPAFAGSPASTASSNAFVVEVDPTKTGPASIPYATYLGGEGTDAGNGIAVDPIGDAFVTGSTTSHGFPLSPNTSTSPAPFQTANKGSVSAFVTELDQTLGKVKYSTYLGGTGASQANAIALYFPDQQTPALAYVTGSTKAAASAPDDFPVVTGGFQVTSRGGSDAFVTEVNGTGSGLVYSSFLGGTGDDVGRGIAMVGTEAEVTGVTASSDFPISPTPPSADDLQPANAGHTDAFVSRVDSFGAALRYSTYLGGSGDDGGAAVATWTDSSLRSYAYVAGTTASSDFPTAPFTPAQGSPSGGAGATSAFVSRIADITGTPVIGTQSGDHQSATIGTAFATPLSAAARPGTDFPSAGIQVTFTAPSSGASGTFASTAAAGCSAGGAATITCATAANGVATTPALIANGTLGSYTVTAHASGASPDASFSLTNAAAATFSPASVDFGRQLVGQSATQTVTLTNTGLGSFAISGIAATPADYGEANNCGTGLAAGASCAIAVTFTPTAAVSTPGSLTVSDSAAGSPHVVTLAGTGQALVCPGPAAPGGILAGWGLNPNGARGSPAGVAAPLAPTNVRDPSGLGTLTGARTVAVSDDHTLVIGTDGRALAFGAGSNGQLGNNTTADSDVPVPVSGLGAGSGVTAVTAGTGYSLALKSDGSVVGWGSDGSGQLGNGSTTDSHVPVAVTGLGSGSGVTAVAAGSAFSLALKSDGSVWAWGSNGNGQLGNGSTTDSPVPVPVTGLGSGSGTIAIAAAGFSGLALRADGSLVSWGRNHGGVLGNGSTADSHLPVPVTGLGAGSGVRSIASGTDFSLALRANGSVMAWGANAAGELGNGSSADSSVPVAVSGLGSGSGVTAVAAGDDVSLALRSNGSVAAWGDNGGRFGNNASAGSNVPTAGPFGPGSGVTSLTSRMAIIDHSRGTIAATGGAAQAAPVGFGFSTPMKVTLVDVTGHPVAGAPVVFSPRSPVALAFSTGAGAAVGITDAKGVATAPALSSQSTAVPGTYSIIASSPAFGNALFTVVVDAITMEAVAGTPQSTLVANAFPVPLRAAARSGGGVLPNYPVLFSITGGGATFAGGAGSLTVLTDASGVATTPTLTAGNSAQSVTVTANGAPIFSLTVASGPWVLSPIQGTPLIAGPTCSDDPANRLKVRLTLAGQPEADASIIFGTPTSGPSGYFDASCGNDQTGDSETTDSSGIATSTFFHGNGIPGTYTVVAESSNLPIPSASFTVTNPGPTITPWPVAAGAAVAAPAGTAYPSLQAHVSGAAGPVPVTFTAPSTGPSGTFAGGALTATVSTDAGGVATAPAFTASTQVGTFTISAATANAPDAALTLTNMPTAVQPCGGTPQRAAPGAAFASPLTAVVTDVGGHAAAGVPVTFTAPSSGATGTFAGGAATAVASSNDAGVATAPAFTANSVTGSYTVAATVPGGAVGAPFQLGNGSGNVLVVNRAGTGTGTVTSNPAGISCGATCFAAFDTGATITLTATPDAGSTFAGWSGGGCSGTGTCTVTVNADTTVTANFAAVPIFTVTVTRAGNGTGGVTSADGGINCGPTCANGYASGTSVTLTATPASGSTFGGWSGSGCSGTGTCALTVNADTTVTATFTSISGPPAVATLPAMSNGAYGGYVTAATIQNTGTAPANVRIAYFDQSGTPVGTGDAIQKLPVNGSWTVRQDNGHGFPGSGGAAAQAGSAIVYSTQPVAAFVNEFAPGNAGDATSYTGIPVPGGVGATLYAPTIVNNAYGGYTTGIGLLNQGTSATNVTISYRDGNGTVVKTQTVAGLAANAYQGLYSGDGSLALPDGFAGTATITGAAGALLGAIVNETGPGGQFSSYDAVPAGATSLNAPAALSNAFGGYNTGMGIQNTGATAGSVSITYYDATGTAAGSAKSLSIPANGYLGVYQGSSTDGPPSAGAYTAVIRSTLPLAAIVNEVAPAGAGSARQSTSYNTSAAGSATLHLPLVENGGTDPWNTGEGIMNTGTASTTVTVTYYNASTGVVLGAPYTSTLAPQAFLGVYQPDPSSGLPAGSRATAVVTTGSGGQVAVICNESGATTFMSYSGQ